MTTPRLPLALDVETAGEKIAESESLSALFSYFKDWSTKDPSLKFKAGSVIKVTPGLSGTEEAA